MTDLGSIPPLGRLFVNPADAQRAKAFVLHDLILAEFGPVCQSFAASHLYSFCALNCPQQKRKLTIAAVVVEIDDW